MKQAAARRVVIAGIVAVLALATGLSPANADASIAIELSATGDNVVPKGRPFEVNLVLENTGTEPTSAEVFFELRPLSRAEGVLAHRVFAQLSPGQRIATVEEVITSRYYRRAGVYRLSVVHGGIERASIQFEVKRSPAKVPRFKDVTERRGITSELPGFDCGDWAAGAAWGDVDGDRDLDLYVPRNGLSNHLWINEGGHFREEGSPRGVATSSASLGAVFVDFDNDGDQDLYVSNDGPNEFFANDGRGTFDEVAASLGVDQGGPTQSASWGDFNADGLLDLYVTNHLRCEPHGRVYYSDALFEQQADNSFVNRTELLSLPASWTHDGAGFQAAWVDIERDGDPDLFLANDFLGDDPRPNVVWRNDGSAGFTDVSQSSGGGLAMNSMGIGIGDPDRDGDFDLAVSDIGAPALFVNDGQGRFMDIAQEAGVAREWQGVGDQAITWGTSFEDFNNDGWEDLFLAAGRLARPTDQPNQLFTNAYDGTFLDHSAAAGIDDPGAGRGVAVADFDSDGRLDLFVANQSGKPTLYRNVTRRNRQHFLAVDVVGRASNRDGCGAAVIVKLAEARLLRQVSCGSTGLASGSDTSIHIGLGARRRIRKLVVEWPSGRRTIKRGVPADRTVRVREPRQ